MFKPSMITTSKSSSAPFSFAGFGGEATTPVQNSGAPLQFMLEAKTSEPSASSLLPASVAAAIGKVKPSTSPREQPAAPTSISALRQPLGLPKPPITSSSTTGLTMGDIMPPRSEVLSAPAPTAAKSSTPPKLACIAEVSVAVEEGVILPPEPTRAPPSSVAFAHDAEPQQHMQPVVEFHDPPVLPLAPPPAASASAGQHNAGSDDVEAVTQTHNALLSTVHTQIAHLGAMSHNVQSRASVACDTAEQAAFALGELQLQVQLVKAVTVPMQLEDGTSVDISPTAAVERFGTFAAVGVLAPTDATGTDDAASQRRLEYARKILATAAAVRAPVA